MNPYFLLAILTCTSLVSYSQLNDDNAFLSNTYDRNIIKEKKIDSIWVTFVISPMEVKRSFVFNAWGNWTRMTTHDTAGKKTSESIIVYDANGRAVSRTDNEGKIQNNIEYVYDDAGRLAKEIKLRSGKKSLTTYLYKDDKLFQSVKKDDGSVLRTTYSYDPDGRVTDITMESSGADEEEWITVSQRKISYGENGKRSVETVDLFGTETINYTYDNADRLVFIKSEKKRQKLDYDKEGLLIKKEVIVTTGAQPLTIFEIYKYWKGE